MTIIDLSRRSLRKLLVSGTAIASLCLGMTATARAETVIRHPGQHTPYGFELEPHLVFDWLDDSHWVGDGIGPGLHMAVPFMHQGPISSINNNMALKFGLDITFGGRCYWGSRYRERYDCDSTSFMLPVALQWNFYITDIITTFGEVGLAIRHSRWPYSFNCNANGTCQATDSDTYALFYSAVGAKFMFGRSVGLTVRMGYPHVTIGASILF